MKRLPAPSNTFAAKKVKILSRLALPEDQYTDASPKGSVDVGIRGLIDQINTAHEGLVTTSSCAGRVSVYLEGPKSPRPPAPGGVNVTVTDVADIGSNGGSGNEVALEGRREDEAVRGLSSAVGGKGGGEWLFVSHDPVVVEEEEDACYERLLLGLEPATAAVSGSGSGSGTQDLGSVMPASRLIHFKFEPMILHVLTASVEHAQLVIQAGIEAGFRETGAVSLLARRAGEEATPMVAVRSMGLSFESLIGVETDGVRRLIVPRQYLKTLVQIANDRFAENKKRIDRFSAALSAAFAPPRGKENWEDAQARRERKRQEGLRRREQLRKDTKTESIEESNADSIIQLPELV